MKLKCLPVLVLAMLSVPFAVFAGSPEVNSGDTSFVLVASFLVFLMTPGLAFFYGGLVRSKNILNTLISIFFVIAAVSIQWVLFGYSLAFGPDTQGITGGFSWFGLNNLPSFIANAPTIPHGAFMMYQMMFAIITPALIIGAFVERIRFPAMIAFIVLWSTLVYDPLAHWVWSANGWIYKLGALDFAGGTVVHISSGIAGLVAALVLGKRKDYGTESINPHNIPFVLLGAGLLWFGWFGFNAGSALGANELAVTAFITTNTSAAAGLISWMVLELILTGRASAIGAASGAVVGLVAITPAAGYVSPLSALLIGLIAAPICYFAISYVKKKFGYDDSLDVFGCHGIGGIWGAIATGIFASKNINPAGNNGLLYGNVDLVINQLIAVGVTILLSGVATYVIIKVISMFMKVRAEENHEEQGLDSSFHGEKAYSGDLDYAS